MLQRIISNKSLASRIGLNVLAGLLSVNALARSGEAGITVGERALTITLPASAFSQADATITTELDGYDISAFSRLNGGVLEINLETPLTPGSHTISVSLFLPNGEIDSLVYREIEYAGSGESAGDWQFNTAFSNSYRADQKENQDYRGVKHYSGNGNLALDGHQRFGSLTFSAKVQALYDSVSENNPDDDEWALPDYHLASTYQGGQAAASLGIGNINVQREDLLFSGFQRRGAAADIVSNSDKYQVKVFGIQSEPTTRYDRDLVTSSGTNEHSSGVTAKINLVDQYLMLSTGYLDGETTLAGAGVFSFGDAIVYGGDSWNMAVDSIWMNSSLWLHLEYAESEFDSDGIGIGLDEESDSATQAMVQFSSDGDLGPGWFDYWSGSLQYKAVGRAFYSIGNLYLPGDLELTRLFFQGGRGSLSLEAEWSREENNIDDEDFLPTQTLDRAGFTLNYSPMYLNPESWLWQFLGFPTAMASFYRTSHSQPGSDALVAGYDLDNEVDESGLTLSFSHNYWNWSLQYQLIDQAERSVEVMEGGFLLYQPPSDQRNELTALQVGWLPNERASINLFVQWNKLEETDFDNTYRNRNLGVDGFFQVIPETLTLQLNYNYGRDRSRLSDNLFIEDDFASHFGNAQLTWHALEANPSRPAVNFYFRGSYGKQDNRAFALVNEQWSAHLGFEMQWAAGGQQ